MTKVQMLRLQRRMAGVNVAAKPLRTVQSLPPSPPSPPLQQPMNIGVMTSRASAGTKSHVLSPSELAAMIRAPHASAPPVARAMPNAEAAAANVPVQPAPAPPLPAATAADVAAQVAPAPSTARGAPGVSGGAITFEHAAGAAEASPAATVSDIRSSQTPVETAVSSVEVIPVSPVEATRELPVEGAPAPPIAQGEAARSASPSVPTPAAASVSAVSSQAPLTVTPEAGQAQSVVASGTEPVGGSDVAAPPVLPESPSAPGVSFAVPAALTSATLSSSSTDMEAIESEAGSQPAAVVAAVQALPVESPPAQASPAAAVASQIVTSGPAAASSPDFPDKVHSSVAGRPFAQQAAAAVASAGAGTDRDAVVRPVVLPG